MKKITGIGTMHSSPAQGLKYLESTSYAFYVVEAHSGASDELAEHLDALHFDCATWNPTHLLDQIHVMSEGGTKPCRVVFDNLSEAGHEQCFELEKLVKRSMNHPIKSLWFVDDGQPVESNIQQKVLMKCELVDCATLLDAVAFGWGEEDPQES